MMNVMSDQTKTFAVILIALAVALGACGRKGNIKPPEDEASAYTFPKVYPAPESVVPQADETPDDTDPEGAGEGAQSP